MICFLFSEVSWSKDDVWVYVKQVVFNYRPTPIHFIDNNNDITAALYILTILFPCHYCIEKFTGLTHVRPDEIRRGGTACSRSLACGDELSLRSAPTTICKILLKLASRVPSLARNPKYALNATISLGIRHSGSGYRWEGPLRAAEGPADKTTSLKYVSTAAVSHL